MGRLKKQKTPVCLVIKAVSHCDFRNPYLFANLTTFGPRSGLKIFYLLQIAIFKMGDYGLKWVKISKS